MLATPDILFQILQTLPFVVFIPHKLTGYTYIVSILREKNNQEHEQ